MRVKFSLFTVGLVFLVGFAAPLYAQDPFATGYDSNSLIRVNGVVTKIEWINPRAWLHVGVTDEKGGTKAYIFQLAPPTVLQRHGWKRNSLKEGEQVTVEGYLARDGSHHAIARLITRADGRKLFDASDISYSANGGQNIVRVTPGSNRHPSVKRVVPASFGWTICSFIQRTREGRQENLSARLWPKFKCGWAGAHVSRQSRTWVPNISTFARTVLHAPTEEWFSPCDEWFSNCTV